MSINPEYIKYIHYKHLYIDTIFDGIKNSVPFDKNKYGIKDESKIFKLIPHYNGDFGYSIGADSLIIMHIDKIQLSKFIFSIKNKINTNISLIVDAMTSCVKGSHKQYAIIQWNYINGNIYYSDYDDGYIKDYCIKIKCTKNIVDNLDILYDYCNTDIEKAFNIMTLSIETFLELLVQYQKKYDN